MKSSGAARRRSGRPATPDLDPVFVALNHGQLPVRARSGGELAERVRRAEDYAVLGARVVVRVHRRNVDRQARGERRQADRASRTDRTIRARAPVQEREVTADAR